MTKDITFYEIQSIKQSIDIFIEKIKEISAEKKFELNQVDKEFFIIISKHIVFFKELFLTNNSYYFFEVLISDFYNFIISIIQNEKRYIYLNQRSIIENYMRAIFNCNVETNHITSNLFELLQENYKSLLSSDDFSLLKSEYSLSCGYIHGSNILKGSLVFYFNECIKPKKTLKNKNKYYNRIKNLLKLYDKILITTYPDFISNVFHRKKSVLKYLLGEDLLEYLFTIVH